MRLKICSLAALGAMIFWSSASKAQAMDQKQMQNFTSSDFYKSLINRALAAVPHAVFQKCPTLVSNGSTVIILKPVSFGQDGFPNAGSWFQKFPISGCGNDTTLNFYFSANAEEKIDTIIGFPGTTHADPTLQRDARLYAFAGLTVLAKGCKNYDVKSTTFEGYGVPNPPIIDPGPSQRLRPWWETWTMVGCGRTFDVPLDFVPNQTGTQVIQPSHIVER